MKRLRVVLLALGAIVGILLVVLIGGQSLGQRAPERVTYAYIAHFNASSATLWANRGLPARRTEVREWADGTRREAFPGDTGGSLALLYEPHSRVIRHVRRPNAEMWRIETLTPEKGGTAVRVEESAVLRTSWHRLLFPQEMKKWAMKALREYGRGVGEPKPVVTRDTSPALAFALATEGYPPGEASNGRAETPLRREAIGSRSADLPEFGEYVYVEERPVPLVKVPPIYPDLARASNVQGTVMILALVGKDGRVKEARVVESVSMLDEAALDWVRQWSFKPALAHGKPVAVWVTIPVRFNLE